MPGKVTFLWAARLLRRQIRRWEQMVRYRRLSLQGVPILFANSFPKSGTHLLTQVLQGFPHIGPAVDSGLPAIVVYEGQSGRQRPSDEIRVDLLRLRPADIAYGHLTAIPEVVSFLCQEGVAAFFILRDPRDVVVSHVHYVTEMEPNHIHHRFYTENLHTFEERLMTSILGRPDPQVQFPHIRARFEPYLAWLDQTEILALRFEEFVADQSAAIGRVIDHAVGRGFPLACDRARAVDLLVGTLDPRRSPTFRTGKSGGWQACYSQAHKQVFKEVAGDLLIRLGYEKDHDW
jgi:hypothetical protein